MRTQTLAGVLPVILSRFRKTEPQVIDGRRSKSKVNQRFFTGKLEAYMQGAWHRKASKDRWLLDVHSNPVLRALGYL